MAVCGRESHGSGAADKGQADHAKPNRSMPNPNHIRVGRDYRITVFHLERHPRTQSLNVPSKELLRTEKLLFIFAALQEFALFFLHSSQ